MATSISSATIPAVRNMLLALDVIVDKAAEHAAAHGVEEAVYLNWRIAPDMFPFATQIRFATEIPARALSRLAGEALPTFSDDEATFADLKIRIEKARTIVDRLDVSALDANPDANVTAPMGPQDVTMPRWIFAAQWILPNVYFHVSAAYLILRGLGVDIGKKDFLIGLAPYVAVR